MILDTSSRCAGKPVLPSLYVRLKSPNALGRLFVLYASKILVSFRVGLSTALVDSPVFDRNSDRNFNLVICFGVS